MFKNLLKSDFAKTLLIAAFLVLMLIIITFSLNSCGNEKYSYDWIIDETVLHPDYPDYPSCFDVHVPKFDLKSPYSDVINAEIIKKIWEYPVTSEEVIENSNFECVKTEIFENGDILSVVIIHQRFPNYGTDGEIFTFNYDLKNKMPVTINYELEKSGKDFDWRIAQQAVTSIHGDGYYTIENLSYDYFYYNSNGDLISAITYNYCPEGADSWRKICFYNVNTGKTTPFTGYESGAEGITYKIG